MRASIMPFHIEVEEDLKPDTPVFIVVKVHNLWHTYDHTNFILQGLTFDLKLGEILGIVGTNGSGKSTLFNILTLGL